jgi:hypothetical protein
VAAADLAAEPPFRVNAPWPSFDVTETGVSTPPATDALARPSADSATQITE